MNGFLRLPSPTVLMECIGSLKQQRWVKYGERYTANRISNSGYVFQWPVVNGKTINQHILPTLRLQTVDHCSYCDSFPLKKGDNSIDHFFPKSLSTYYHLVCQWENLYFACSHCQESKAENVNSLVIRPDEAGYSFQRYFVYNYVSHQIEINPLAIGHDQQRAIETITFFDFNNAQLVISRRHAFERYNGAIAPQIDDYNYRFMFV